MQVTVVGVSEANRSWGCWELLTEAGPLLMRAVSWSAMIDEVKIGQYSGWMGIERGKARLECKQYSIVVPMMLFHSAPSQSAPCFCQTWAFNPNRELPSVPAKKRFAYSMECQLET